MSKHIDDMEIDDSTVCLIQDFCNLKWPESFIMLEPAVLWASCKVLLIGLKWSNNPGM